MKAERTIYEDFLTPDKAKRSKGCHLSDVLKYMLRTLNPEVYGADVTDETRKLWELGFIVEEAISDAFARRKEDGRKALVQREVFKDGIYMTPDAFDTVRWLVREYKYTAISSLRDITDIKLRHWLWQVKAYCHFWETLRAELIAVHAFGDYRSSRSILPVKWTLEFKQRELDLNWRMILSNKRRMEQEAA